MKDKKDKHERVEPLEIIIYGTIIGAMALGVLAGLGASKAIENQSKYTRYPNSAYTRNYQQDDGLPLTAVIGSNGNTSLGIPGVPISGFGSSFY